MSREVISLKKVLLANIAVENFLESQLKKSTDDKLLAIQNLEGAIIDEVNKNLDSISPGFKIYLSKTIANFKSLNDCYYYKETQDTDTITIKNYLLTILRSGVSFGRTFITLPTYGLPKKAFKIFLNNLGITVTRCKGMSIFIQEIPRAKDDKTNYVCFNLNFRET